MNILSARTLSQDIQFPGTLAAVRQGLVVIVSDDQDSIERLAPVCEFVDLQVQTVSTEADLLRVLRVEQPMAVIVDAEGGSYDGFHVMKLIADHNRDLPVLMLTGGDPALMGAADAVQEVWGLTQVTATSEFPLAGQIVAFLFNAGRRAGCMRLLPV